MVTGVAHVIGWCESLGAPAILRIPVPNYYHSIVQQEITLLTLTVLLTHDLSEYTMVIIWDQISEDYQIMNLLLQKNRTSTYSAKIPLIKAACEAVVLQAALLRTFRYLSKIKMFHLRFRPRNSEKIYGRSTATENS